MKYTLNKPITIGDAEVSELDLREMTGKDMIEIGFPYLIITSDDAPQIKIQAGVIVKYISKLAAIPPSAVEKISPLDISGLTGVVMGFFGQ